MDLLLKRIWAKLRGNPRVEEVKAAIEGNHRMTPEQVNQIAAYLQVAMDEDPQVEGGTAYIGEIHQYGGDRPPKS